MGIGATEVGSNSTTSRMGSMMFRYAMSMLNCCIKSSFVGPSPMAAGATLVGQTQIFRSESCSMRLEMVDCILPRIGDFLNDN
jgi:hypothetical protein